MDKVHLGVVGAGSIAGFTAREILSHPQAELVGITDVNAERANAFASAHGVETVYDSAAAMFASQTVDAVYVAVPNIHHAPLASAALEAGKHVLLDKPFATSLGEAESVAACAEAHNRTLMLGMNQRFERNVQRARLLHADGRFGEVYHAKAFWCRRAGIPRIGSWFTSKAVSGGGALLDIGVHMLDATLHIIDNFEPVAVSGTTFTRFGPRGMGDGAWGRSEREHTSFDVDDFAVALIRMANGAAISLDAAWASHQRDGNRMGIELFGDDAGMSVYENVLFRDGDDGSYHQVQNPAGGELPFPHCSRVHHFVNVLLGNEKPAVTVAEALTVQKILDAIYESARSGEEVRL